MPESSPMLSETARKSLTLVLQGLSESGSGAAIAKDLGISEATVSRLKNEHLAHFVGMLGWCGLKVVNESDVTVDINRLRAVTLLAHHSLSSPDQLFSAVTEEGK